MSVDLKTIIDRTPLDVVRPMTIRPDTQFVIVTYWWGAGRNNRNLQRPCPPDDPGAPQIPMEALIPPYKSYDAMIDDWKRDCEAIGCPYIAQEYPEFAQPGMYQTAINAKPLFIQKALGVAAAAGFQGVVYIDGDMRFKVYPAIFNLAGVDYMARGWNIDPRASSQYESSVCFDPYTFETSGGIMYFGNTRASRSLLYEWIRANDRLANKGKADDRIVSVIVNIKGYLTKANIVQLPIEYLWLNDFYDADLNGHVRPDDINPRQIICEHPHCLTSEERAREQGANQNRQHILYYHAVESRIRCNRMGHQFYEYIFFESPGEALDSYKTYLRVMEELTFHGRRRPTSVQGRRIPSSEKEPCLYWTTFENRYGARNRIADARLAEGRWSIGDVLRLPSLQSPQSPVVEIIDGSLTDILAILISGQAVLWLPKEYTQMQIAKAYGRIQSRRPAAASSSAAKGSSRYGGAPIKIKQAELKKLQTTVEPLKKMRKAIKQALRKFPDLECVAFVEPGQDQYAPVFNSKSPVYFSPNSRILRHLLLMSRDLMDMNKVLNSTFIFTLGIRCKWMVYKEDTQ